MFLAFALGGLFIGLFAGWVAIRLISGIGSASFKGYEIPSAEPLGGFTLTAHTGERVHLQDFRDQVVLVYFGYTFCPDICPATLAELSRAVEKLNPKDREQVQVLMITVDPDRDSPEVLAEYLAHFDSSFLGLTGTLEQLAAAAESFGIFYQKREGTAATGYLIDHTATVAAVDKGGYLRLMYPFNTPGKDIEADLRRLTRE
jgi:protein SCO1/2